VAPASKGKEPAPPAADDYSDLDGPVAPVHPSAAATAGKGRTTALGARALTGPKVGRVRSIGARRRRPGLTRGAAARGRVCAATGRHQHNMQYVNDLDASFFAQQSVGANIKNRTTISEFQRVRAPSAPADPGLPARCARSPYHGATVSRTLRAGQVNAAGQPIPGSSKKGRNPKKQKLRTLAPSY